MKPEQRAKWANVWADDGGLHLVPIEDVVWHDFCDDCLCGPKSELHHAKADGSDIWYVIHQAMDERP
ncbi:MULTISPECIES: hypothetical protein [unclassified Amycolatopsis]|uniref:hypothetical protein n=1 Tax=unclassified Amycolatopsis TaxID=2618356 RepID=UPI001C69E248|nr:hypothetical protein [Amycolatopsis sp. DSM 110486]QYN18614.1 hypothetical protein K1T34_38670 [Amycolatopsis sp. DSM 110486]